MFCIFVLVLFSYTNIVNGFIDGLYCGKQDCYEVLEVTRDASKSDIARAYRKLAKKFHPDMHKTQEMKKKAAETFTSVATAYEVLKDEDSRRDYNYMLDHPDEIYGHYYRYYRHRMAPKVDVRIVIAVTITIVSVVQYWGAWSRYKAAVDYLITVPKYRIKAVEIAKQEKLLDSGRKRDRRPKEIIKEEEEAILKKILEEKIDIRGGYSKPSIKDILWIKLILLPYALSIYIWWNMNWFWKFTIKGQEYGIEEKYHFIKKYLKCSQSQWEAISQEEKDEFLSEKLWIKANFQAWKEAKDEEMKAKLAQSARYKSYRRYMKNHGPGQITFED